MTHRFDRRVAGAGQMGGPGWIRARPPGLLSEDATAPAGRRTRGASCTLSGVRGNPADIILSEMADLDGRGLRAQPGRCPCGPARPAPAAGATRWLAQKPVPMASRDRV